MSGCWAVATVYMSVIRMGASYNYYTDIATPNSLLAILSCLFSGPPITLNSVPPPIICTAISTSILQLVYVSLALVTGFLLEVLAISDYIGAGLNLRLLQF